VLKNVAQKRMAERIHSLEEGPGARYWGSK
jgi:hypothetical protein